MQWITTDEIRRETWARLLNYANNELCFDSIVQRHGSPHDDSTKSNYSKQAYQIRVTLLQAREYFRAAEVATVFTRPNLLYYGMVSLASAAMLMNGDGTFSLDKLRSDKTNKSHGLKFTTGITHSAAGVGTTLLERTNVTVLANGFFLNWYRNTRTTERIYAETTTYLPDNTTRKEYAITGIETNAVPQSIVGRTFTLSTLICQLPDLYLDAAAAGLPIISSRVNYEIQHHPGRNTRISQWRIHGAGGRERLLQILEGFAFSSNLSDQFTILPDDPQNHCIITSTADLKQPAPFRFPAIRQTIANDQVIYALPTIDVPEYAQYFIIMYALSMFARYLPDLWLSCIDSHCKSARLIERLIADAEKKFPIMILGLLASDDIVISSHRPPWQV